MTKITKNGAVQNLRLKKFFFWLLLAYLAVLPIAHTTAMRNLMLVMLVSLLVCAAVFRRHSFAIDPLSVFKQIPLALSIWVLFLILFPLFAVEPGTAWANLKGQWGQSILAWLIGLGAVALLGRNGPGLWALGVASAFPVAVHLMLTFLAWSGLLGPSVATDMPLSSVWSALSATIANPSGWQWNQFPWGFRGLDPMHGNLGYAACQAIALFATCFYFAWREQNQMRVWGAIVSIALCFSSVLIASSRGAVLYGVLVIVFAFLIARLQFRQSVKFWISPKATMRLSFSIMGSIAVGGLLVLTAVKTATNDSRWTTMADKAVVGFLADDAIDVLCNGVPMELEVKIQDRFAGRGSEYAETLISGLKTQDGGRVLLMRAGVDLVLEHPTGVGGSRQTYKNLIEARCGHLPMLEFAHPHQAWIDMALALGWVGVLLFAFLMLNFLRVGLTFKSDVRQLPWAFALSIISLFWILRGFTDGVYREHYLQMQAILIGYLFWRLKLVSTKTDMNESPVV